MPENDLALLTEVAEAAGDLACSYAGERAKHWEKPDGAGPVTEADIAVNDLLEERLRRARPGYGWLSEETEDGPERLSAERVFIIDPIDGTRNFMDGGRTWAHSIAIAERGVVTAAVVYLPQREKLYAAAAGQGATLNGTPVQASARPELDGAQMLAAKPLDQSKNWKGPVPGYTRAYRPSLAYRLCLVAEGRFDAMTTLRRSWEWDIAAGDLILREAGAQTSDKAGGALIFNNAAPQLNGVICANPALHRTITQALA